MEASRRCSPSAPPARPRSSEWPVLRWPIDCAPLASPSGIPPASPIGWPDGCWGSRDLRVILRRRGTIGRSIRPRPGVLLSSPRGGLHGILLRLPSEHFVQLFDTPDSLADTVGEFVCGGLRRASIVLAVC